MRINLDDALADLRPVGPDPTIPVRRSGWPYAALAVLAAALIPLAASVPGEPLAMPDRAGIYEPVLVPRGAVLSQCDRADSTHFDVRGDAFLAGQWLTMDAQGSHACLVGFVRKPVQPPFTMPPSDPLTACADAVGYPSFNGWALRYSQQQPDEWRGLLQSRNDWYATCAIGTSMASVEFLQFPKSNLIPLHEGIAAVQLEGQGEHPAQRVTALFVSGEGPVWMPDGSLAVDAASVVASFEGVPGEFESPVTQGYVAAERHINVDLGPIDDSSVPPRVTYVVRDARGAELFTVKR